MTLKYFLAMLLAWKTQSKMRAAASKNAMLSLHRQRRDHAAGPLDLPV
jgi:hypothetical protein